METENQIYLNAPKKRNHLIPIIIAIAAGAALAVFLICFNLPSARYARAMDLGNRYLDEEKYESALMAFDKAITIEPKVWEPYEGKVLAYHGLKDCENAAAAYEAGKEFTEPGNIPEKTKGIIIEELENLAEKEKQSGKYEDAIRHYNEASELGRDETERINALYIHGALDLNNSGDIYASRDFLKKVNGTNTTIYGEIQFLIEQLEQLEKACQEADPDASSVMKILSENDYQNRILAMDAEGFAPRYINNSNMLIGFFPVSVSTRNFDGLSYMLYYGEQKDGVRNGHGKWYAWSNGNVYVADGNWADDKPNGNFMTRSWQENLSEEVTKRVISGNVTNGLWDGKITWAFEITAGTDYFFPTINAGKFAVIGKIDDNTYNIGDGVLANGKKESMVSNEEDLNIIHGIAGFADEA